MKLNHKLACVLFSAILLLVGCSSEDPGASVTEPTSNEQAAEPIVDDGSELPEHETASPESDVQPLDIEPDESIMATMSCDVLDVEKLEWMWRFGWFDRAVSVEVCEIDGVTWWVLVADHKHSDGQTWVRKAYLCDALEGENASDGTWIELDSSDAWRNVDWDTDLLVRAESALEFAKETLTGLDWAR